MYEIGDRINLCLKDKIINSDTRKNREFEDIATRIATNKSNWAGHVTRSMEGRCGQWKLWTGDHIQENGCELDPREGV